MFHACTPNVNKSAALRERGTFSYNPNIAIVGKTALPAYGRQRTAAKLIVGNCTALMASTSLGIP